MQDEGSISLCSAFMAGRELLVVGGHNGGQWLNSPGIMFSCFVFLCFRVFVMRYHLNQTCSSTFYFNAGACHASILAVLLSSVTAGAESGDSHTRPHSALPSSLLAELTLQDVEPWEVRLGAQMHGAWVEIKLGSVRSLHAESSIHKVHDAVTQTFSCYIHANSLSSVRRLSTLLRGTLTP